MKIIIMAYNPSHIQPEDLIFLKEKLEANQLCKIFFIQHYSIKAEPIYSAAIFTTREN